MLKQYLIYVKILNIYLPISSIFFLSVSKDAYNTDEMAKEFIAQFCGQAFTVGQQLAFSFDGKKHLGEFQIQH